MEQFLKYLDAWYVEVALYVLFFVVAYLGSKNIIEKRIIAAIGQIAYDIEKKTNEDTTIDDILDSFLNALTVFGFNFDKETIEKKIEADIKK